MQAHKKGEGFFKEKQYIRAITYYDRAIHWYTPFNPYVEKSAKRLWEISEIADKNGDIRISLIAAETLRGAFYSASGFNDPGKNWIHKCDQKIQTLLLLERGGKEAENGPKGSGESITENKAVPPPSVFWTAILEIGFLGWLGAVICLIFALESDQRDRLPASRAMKWGGLVFIFYLMWIAGMMKA